MSTHSMERAMSRLAARTGAPNPASALALPGIHQRLLDVLMDMVTDAATLTHENKGSLEGPMAHAPAMMRTIKHLLPAFAGHLATVPEEDMRQFVRSIRNQLDDVLYEGAPQTPLGASERPALPSTNEGVTDEPPGAPAPSR